MSASSATLTVGRVGIVVISPRRRRPREVWIRDPKRGPGAQRVRPWRIVSEFFAAAFGALEFRLVDPESRARDVPDSREA